jgi:phage shock protein PspC (stress-responsive transcriptional regulator)
MKKIININFHGRVVPIEETAYEILQQYIESLRMYFANEEGRDEIINDIENRFAELFSESLKKGANCITDADVNTIIASMGRPADFEQDEMGQAPSGSSSGANAGAGSGAAPGYGAGAGSKAGSGQQSTGDQQSSWQQTTDGPRRLYRSENDKLLGGVCAGLANYLRLDPAIVRILFALITFGGFGLGFVLYIILWVVVPPKSLAANVKKRLYRNPDDRVLGGVAGGLASYFHIEVWIPRLIFALPLILGILTSVFHNLWWNFRGPWFVTGGFGGSLFVSYIVLWMVLPEAVTASEKLEMRGEKVDLESIKNTIRSDMEGFKGRAKDMGNEMKERFQKVGEEMKQSTQNFAAEAYPAARKTGTGLGHAIGILFKAFFLFIAGSIAFALVMALIGLIFGGAGVMNLKSYILMGFWQNFLAWTSFILFLVTPVIALLTWLIRRITGTRSRSHYLGYTFASLWVIGLICFICLAGMVINNFRSRQHVEETVQLSQPTHGKLLVRVADAKADYFDHDGWFDYDWENHGVFINMNEDSLVLRTIRLNLVKSPDAGYHARLLKFSLGNDSHTARDLAGQIVFPVLQADSILWLPHGFAVTKEQRFRNQQVLVEISIPVGGRIVVDRDIDDFRWFNINIHNRHFRWNNHGNDDWGDFLNEQNDWGANNSWSTNAEYVMTNDGLVRTERPERMERNENPEHPERKEHTESKERTENPEQPEKDGDGYRYKSHTNKDTDAGKPKVRKDSAVGKPTAMAAGSEAPVYLLSALFNQ